MTEDTWPAVEALLLDWSYQACLNRIRNAKKAKLNKSLHHLLGMLVVISSSVVGSVAFTQIHEAGNDRARFIAGTLSIVSAVLAGLQTFFRFGEVAEKYRAIGMGYERMEREIEEILASPLPLRGEVSGRISSLREQMNFLAENAPNIPDHRHLKQKS